MKLIKPSYEILEQGHSLNDMYKQIEKVGRTCYKSEDKITNESAKPFVDRMISSKHYAMLEHGTIYLDCPQHVFTKYIDNPYSKCEYTKSHIEMDEEYCSSLYYTDKQEYFFVTTNMRVLVENSWLDDLQYLCEPTEFHERRICVKFTCDRGVSHEFVRHRVFSFAQESTRYCNYSKDKFENEITYILPPWMDDLQVGVHDSKVIVDETISYDWDTIGMDEQEIQEVFFMQSLALSEVNYMDLLKHGWKAQEARNILPNALKTELVMTGFESDWKHFFDLRAYGVTGKPHPQASELAIPLLNEFITKGYLHGR